MILQANLGQNSNVLEMKSKPLNHLRLDNFKRLNIIETLLIDFLSYNILKNQLNDCNDD